MKLQIGQRDQHGVAVFLEFLQHLSPPRKPARPLCCPGSSAVQFNRSSPSRGGPLAIFY